jgi:CheY-like chemotaxis protein
VKHLILEVEKIIKDTFIRSIMIRVSAPKNLWTINGDATQLYQVLMNLCVNARDAMPNGGMLKLEAKNTILDEQYARMHVDAKPGPYILLSVSDSGTGIPPGIIEKIFEPFFTTKELGRGTGLGLSTVVGIVKSHGGFVNVYSEVGKGTTFSVYIPAVESAETQHASEEPEALPRGNGEMVLVVDDELAVREITKTTLEHYGYRVLVVNDGTEAVVLYAQRGVEFAAVVTDMMMPYMDGAATIRALQKLNPLIKMIAVSGLVENQKITEITDSKSVKFIQKPFTTEKLLLTLRNLLQGS